VFATTKRLGIPTKHKYLIRTVIADLQTYLSHDGIGCYGLDSSLNSTAVHRIALESAPKARQGSLSKHVCIIRANLKSERSRLEPAESTNGFAMRSNRSRLSCWLNSTALTLEALATLDHYRGAVQPDPDPAQPQSMGCKGNRADWGKPSKNKRAGQRHDYARSECYHLRQPWHHRNHFRHRANKNPLGPPTTTAIARLLVIICHTRVPYAEHRSGTFPSSGTLPVHRAERPIQSTGDQAARKCATPLRNHKIKQRQPLL